MVYRGGQPRRDPMHRNELGQKLCTQCNQYRDEGHYTRHQASRDRLLPSCRFCAQRKRRASYYGTDEDWFERTFEAQGRVCALCGSEKSGAREFHIDHDHLCCPKRPTCGQCNRAILCHSCNSGLGAFGDDVDRLAQAIEYINHWRRK